MPTIKGTAMWAFTAKKSGMSGKYQMDLCHLDDAAIETVRKTGAEVKRDEKNPPEDRNYKGTYITVKSGFKPEVFDSQMNEVGNDVIIGNGSTVEVVVKPKPWDVNGNHGVVLYMQKVQILDLKEYEGGLAPQEGGFQYTPPAPQEEEDLSDLPEVDEDQPDLSEFDDEIED